MPPRSRGHRSGRVERRRRRSAAGVAQLRERECGEERDGKGDRCREEPALLREMRGHGLTFRRGYEASRAYRSHARADRYGRASGARPQPCPHAAGSRSAASARSGAPRPDLLRDGRARRVGAEERRMVMDGVVADVADPHAPATLVERAGLVDLRLVRAGRVDLLLDVRATGDDLAARSAVERPRIVGVPGGQRRAELLGEVDVDAPQVLQADSDPGVPARPCGPRWLNVSSTSSSSQSSGLRALSMIRSVAPLLSRTASTGS